MHRPSIKKVTALFTITGWGCALASFWVTYQGLLNYSDNPAFSFVLSGVASVVSLVVLHVLCLLLPDADSQTRWKLIGVALLGLAFVLAISTSMGIRGMAAPQAQLLDLRDLLDEAEARLEQAQIDQHRQAQASSFLHTQAGQLKAMGQHEAGSGTRVEGGSHSRSAQDLEALAQAYSAAADSVGQDQMRRLKAGEDASAALGQLRALVSGARANAQDIRELEQPFATHLREFNVSLAALESSALGAVDVLAPVTQVLTAQQESPYKSTRRSRSEAKLNDEEKKRRRRDLAREEKEKQSALTTMHQRNQQILEETQAALADMVSQPQPHEDLQPRDPMVAVWVYRRAVADLIAIPVALDLAVPLITMLVLSVMGSSTPSSPSPLRLPEPPIYETPSPRMRISQLRSAGAQQRRVGPRHPDR